MKITKVCFILPSLNAGGAENYILRFVKYSEKYYDITVLALNESKGDLHSDFEKYNTRIKYFSIGYFNLYRLYKLYAFFKRNNFDVVATLNGNFGGLPLYVARLCNVKNRIALYRRSTNAFKNQSIKLVYNSIARRLILQNATTILSNSKFAFENFFYDEYKFDKRFMIIYNSVNSNEFVISDKKNENRIRYGIPSDKIVIGHIGRFDPAKNHSTIFKVASELCLTGLNLHFVFCGKNTDSQGFIQAANRYIKEDDFTILGLQKNLPEVYSCFDIFYFPSITEGQPNALIEAMLCGLPIVASNIPPIKEFFPEDLSIYLVDPLDVDSAKDKLVHLISNCPNNLSDRLRNFAIDNFDYNTNFLKFKDVIDGH